MDTERLYRVKKKDLPQLESLLTECFLEDPLYQKLIPDRAIRLKLLPKLFKSDLMEYFKECEIYADSDKLNSIIVFSDESEVYNVVSYYFSEILATIRTDSYLIKEDPSLKTLHNFMKGKDYLNSKWTEKLHDTKRLHIIYLAVRPSMRNQGLSGQLLKEITSYADKMNLMISLETHNEMNVPLYLHYGFEVYEEVNRKIGLTQYCLIRKHKQVSTFF